jgi:hypothetical protein
LLDGTLAFNNKANLMTSPLVPINVNEKGQVTHANVWTYTAVGGALGVDCTPCNDPRYPCPPDKGTCGSSDANDGTWTNQNACACVTGYSLYCFEQ